MKQFDLVHYASGATPTPMGADNTPIGWVVVLTRDESHGDWKTAAARNIRGAKQGERALLVRVFFNMLGRWATICLEDGVCIDVPPTSLRVTSTERHSKLPDLVRPVGDPIKISTLLTEGGVEQLVDIAGQVSRHVADVAAMQFDQGIRAKLIELGWTPPREGA